MFLKWFFVIIILEAAILLSSINKDFFLYKVLINYLFVAGILPLIYLKIKDGFLDLFSPLVIFTSFYLLFFGVRAIDLLIFNKQVIIEDEIFYNYTIFYSIIGLHFFQIGYFSKIGKIIFANNKKIDHEWSDKKVKEITLIYFMFSLIAFFVVIKLTGGISEYFNNIHSATINITTGSAFIFMGVLIVKIPLLILFYDSVKNYKNRRLFLVTIFFALIIFGSLGERGHIIALIISLIAVYHYAKKRISILRLSTYGIALLIFLTIFGEYRELSKAKKKIAFESIEKRVGLVYLYRSLINNFDQLIRTKDIVKNTPETIEFQYGKTILNLVFKPIPSRIWESKPQGAGLIVTKYVYPKHHKANVTVAPSLLGELYLNFHLIGIIIGMFIFGIACRVLYEFLIKNLKNSNVVVVYAFFVPYIFSELRGDFAVVGSFLIFNLIFLYIALLYISQRTMKYKNI